MSNETLSRRTVTFVNIAHAFDHFVLLIYPTAVIAIAAERNLDYAQLITLATGAFVAFGLFSLPMGWIAERVGRRNMLAVFYFGYGASCIAMATCNTSVSLAACLVVLGVFSAIYHPIGSTMLVSHARQLGRDLGWNGVWGNMGAAFASAVTAFLAASLGWRWAFAVPGIVCMVVGLAFIMLVPGDGEPANRQKTASTVLATSHTAAVLAIMAVAIIAGGMTFNITTIALPKVIDEGIGISLPLVLTGSFATAVFVMGALTQLAVGRLLDRYNPSSVFVGMAIFQPLGLALAAATTGAPMLLGLAMTTSAIYGQVVINDAMIARYVTEKHRAKAFSVRYFLGFTASGFAVPLIAWLHARGGFPMVLNVAAIFGGVVAFSALAFKAITAAKQKPAVASIK